MIWKSAAVPPMSKRYIICISKTVGVPKVENERRIRLQIIESQAAQIAKLTEQVAALTAQVEELIQKLNEKNHRKTSRNSSAPPSSDGYAKPAPKSQRKSSGAKVGGSARRCRRSRYHRWSWGFCFWIRTLLSHISIVLPFEILLQRVFTLFALA